MSQRRIGGAIPVWDPSAVSDLYLVNILRVPVEFQVSQRQIGTAVQIGRQIGNAKHLVVSLSCGGFSNAKQSWSDASMRMTVSVRELSSVVQNIVIEWQCWGYQTSDCQAVRSTVCGRYSFQ